MDSEKEKRIFSSIQVYKDTLTKLNMISLLVGKSQLELIDQFISDFYDAIYPHIGQVLAEKTRMLYEVRISACPLDPSFIFGSRQVSFTKTNKQLDAELYDHIEREYESKEGSKIE